MCLGRNTQIRGIKARRLSYGLNTLTERNRPVHDVIGLNHGGLGVLKMNKEHRNNLLTPTLAEQVQRGISSFDIDTAIKFMFVSSEKGQHFSNGTDFRTLLHYVNSGELDKAADYLDQIFNLQVTMAKINKPVMSVAPGYSFNSGLGLLVASGMPSICHNSRMAFNECTFGFVPHAGATYYAQRLQGEMGTYLLLTGASFSGKDAISLGLADKLVDQPSEYVEEVAYWVRAMDPDSMPFTKAALNQ